LERRLGYSFRNPELIERALTHPSAIADYRGDGHLDNYQRLEFLGDRVLGLVVADLLMNAFPDVDEGDLHRRHASLVRKESCAEVGVELGIGEALHLGEGEENSGGREKATILGDACEAVIGAIYLDGGLKPARKLIERCWSGRIDGAHRARRDAKSALQEWVQAKGLPVPSYRVTSEDGPPHAPRFAVEVEIEGYAPECGVGPSKRDAEREAATRLLSREGVWPSGQT
jgi:ribonuclease-3